MRAARTVIQAALATVVLLGWPLAWLMRDGLGPDAGESHGLAALGRTSMTFWVGPITGLLMALAILLAVRRECD